MDQTLVNVNEYGCRAGAAGAIFGFNDVMGRLYGTLLMSPEPSLWTNWQANSKSAKGREHEYAGAGALGHGQRILDAR